MATGGSGGSQSSCGVYDGALAISGASKIFKSGYGTSTAGSWHGYAYADTYGTGAIIKPKSIPSAICFQGATVCVAGSVPALNSAGAYLGWTVNNPMNSSAGTVAISGSVRFFLAGARAGMRVVLTPGTSDPYCYPLTGADAMAANSAAGLTVQATAFKLSCYDAANAVPYAGSPITAIEVQAPGSAVGAQTFDYCLVDIEPG